MRSILPFCSALLLMPVHASGIVAQPGPAAAPRPPADVSIPAGFQGNPIDFFDDYSWRLLDSMVWPSDPAKPGEPAADGSASGSLVFEAFKSNADTFQPGGADPGEFAAAAPQSPCGPQAAKRDALVIVAFSKFEELQQAGFGTLVGPIVAQNRSYVRYLTGYNRIAYDHIRNNKLYLRASQPKDFPDGAIVTKSAWVEMAGVAHPERFYRRMAWISDPQTGSCSRSEVGLAGLHIVQKTASRPQWTWSTFEQVDNVPDKRPAAGPATFHDGSATAMPRRNPYSLPAAQVPPPFNIERLVPIDARTVKTNAEHQAARAGANSVWQFYRLVMTQWPLGVARPQDEGSPDKTFPGSTEGGVSAYANVTMETFDQTKIRTGCMACHNETRADSDFVWSVSTHAFPVDNAALFTASVKNREEKRSLQRLRQLLESGLRK